MEPINGEDAAGIVVLMVWSLLFLVLTVVACRYEADLVGETLNYGGNLTSILRDQVLDCSGRVRRKVEHQRHVAEERQFLGENGHTFLLHHVVGHKVV